MAGASGRAAAGQRNAAVRAPRSLTEAQRLCEGFAAIDAEIAAIEEARDVAIAAANAQVDRDLAPLLTRREAIRAKLEPWWAENSGVLTQGMRKSAELGGCILKSASGRQSLVLAVPEAEVIAALQKRADGRLYLRSKVELVKAAVTAALGNDGPEAEMLAALGLRLERGPDVFSIQRTGQAGTQAKVQR